MKFAVLGDPIDHSQSPAIHAAAYRELSLDWTYDRHRVNADELSDFLDRHLVDYSGFSLTMPLKERLFAIATELGWQIDAASQALGCANTIYRVDGKLAIANTDVLGSGATARSVSYALAQSLEGLSDLVVFSRRNGPAEAIFSLLSEARPGLKTSWLPLEAAADFGGADLTVNTIPASTGAELEVDQKFGRSWVFDVSYHPWPTPFAANWPEPDRIGGLEMLVQQAIRQLSLFGAIERDPEPGMVERLASAMKAAAA
jgi:shikimate dehydrogenase